MRKFVIGCDNAAVEMKDTLKAFLQKQGAEVEDVGCFSSDDPTNYPTIAEKACNLIAESGFEKRGVLVCGTGIGMCMTANKCKGIRAAVGHDIFRTAVDFEQRRQRDLLWRASNWAGACESNPRRMDDARIH